MKIGYASIVAAAVLSAPMVRAQPTDSAQVERFDRQLESIRRNTRLSINPEVPVSERAYLDYGGYTTVSYLSLDNPSLTNTAFWQYETGAYLDLIFDGTHEFFFRGHLFHRDFNPGDRFNSDGENVDGRVDALFYKFDLSHFQAAYQGKQTDSDVSIKLGRDLVLWGNGLTLSTDMDGGVVDLSYGAADLQLIAGVTPLDTVDFDSARPRFDSRTERGLYGALGTLRAGTHHLYAYGLIQRDYNNDRLTADDTIDGQPATPTLFHYDSHYLGIGASGALTDRLLYGVEAVYEGGHTLSSSFVLDETTDPETKVRKAQTNDRIEAFAMDAKLDYVIPDAHATRFSGEMLLASGDDARISSTNTTYGGAAPHSVDRAFNALGLPDVGVAFAPVVSNLLMFRAGVSTFPFTECKPLRKMQLGSEFYAFAKFDRNAPTDEPTTNSLWLGIEPDVYMNWQITSDVAWTARYGVFIPGDATENDGKMRQFIYTGVTISY
jgi:Alginate export